MIRPHYVPLYQSVCTSEKLADLASDSHRLFYVLLLTHMDSWGRCTGAARVLTAKVWPMLGKSVKDTEKALADLERVGLIQRYEHEGGPALAVPDWEEKAGKVGKLDRRGPSLFPNPPACRTTPAYGPDTQPAVGVDLPRARAQSEPRGEDQSRAEPSPPCAAPAQDRPPWDAAVAELAPLRERTEWAEGCAEHAAARKAWGHKALKEATWKLRLAEWVPKGLATFRAAVRENASTGYQGLIEAKGSHPQGTIQKGPSRGQIDARDLLFRPNEPVKAEPTARETTATIIDP